MNGSYCCEIRDSCIHDAAWASPGSGAYAVSLAESSSEILFESNIPVRANKVLVARCRGAGSVFGYNCAYDGFVYSVTEIFARKIPLTPSNPAK